MAGGGREGVITGRWRPERGTAMIDAVWECRKCGARNVLAVDEIDLDELSDPVETECVKCHAAHHITLSIEVAIDEVMTEEEYQEQERAAWEARENMNFLKALVSSDGGKTWEEKEINIRVVSAEQSNLRADDLVKPIAYRDGHVSPGMGAMQRVVQDGANLHFERVEEKAS